MIIEQTNLKDKATSKSGKDYWQCGIKVNGVWYNGTLWDQKEVDKFQKINTGMDVPVITFKEEYNGKEYDKFKFPTRLDLLEQRVEVLESQNGLVPNAPEADPTPEDYKDTPKDETPKETPKESPKETPEPKEESDDLPF